MTAYQEDLLTCCVHLCHCGFSQQGRFSKENSPCLLCMFFLTGVHLRLSLPGSGGPGGRRYAAPGPLAASLLLQSPRREHSPSVQRRLFEAHGEATRFAGRAHRPACKPATGGLGRQRGQAASTARLLYDRRIARVRASSAPQIACFQM